MTITESNSRKLLPAWLSRQLYWLVTSLGVLIRAGFLTWVTLAIYWSNLPWGWLRLLLALAFLTFGVGVNYFPVVISSPFG
jgi:hypothetical protein